MSARASLSPIQRSVLINLLSMLFPILALSQNDSKPFYQDHPGDLGFYSQNSYSQQNLNWGYSFEQLLSDAQKHQPRSVEEFIRILPQPLLSNYLIMYQSRSLQQASPENPRIILFTPRADTAISFNGHSRQRGYEKIEMMHFDYKTNGFIFREVSFDPQKGFEISKPNPALCLRCHQSPDRKDVNPRPNWEPYSIWPGSVGSVDGRLDDILKERHPGDALYQRLSQQDHEYLQLQSQEYEILNRFIQNKKNHSRYSFLGIPKNEKYRFDGPTQFSQMVSNLNARRIVKEVMSHSLYPQIRETFWASIKCSELPLSFEALDWLQKNQTFKEIVKRSSSELHITEKFHLLFEPLGFDTSDWSMDFKTRGRLASFERMGTPGNTSDHFLRALNLLDPEHTQVSCEKLKSISIQKMDQLVRIKKSEPKKVEFTPAQRLQKVIQSCTSCHDGSSEAPEISFDQPQELKKELQWTGFKRGTLLNEIIHRTGDQAPIHEAMPANRVLKKEDLDLFLHYIKSL